MLYKEHLLEIFVNGNKLDINQDDINLRLNAVLYDPEKISSTQAEYSFQIEAPSTPNNDKIFDYANNLSKLNKFHQRLKVEVYADGTLIFDGTLVLNGFKNKKYICNLIAVKVFSLSDIFGESVMTDFDWYIPFSGATSINQYNSNIIDGFCFPLISYGVFQKSPLYKDDVGSDYSSKFLMDKYNRWYIESFYPSLNMLETLKRVFEYKGYNVGGDAFSDETLKNIYMSCNLAEGQAPDYNLGNPLFGKVQLSTNWSTPHDTSGETFGTVQDLTYPYYRVGSDENFISEATSYYNFTDVRLYNMLSSREGGNVTLSAEKSYMYQPDENLIVIPSDGFYKIDINVSAALTQTSTFTANMWTENLFLQFSEQNITLNPNFNDTCPLEIQLVRNYNSNIELIKGKWNVWYADGNPNDEWFLQNPNLLVSRSCFPHEDPKSLFPLPTKLNNLTNKWTPNTTWSSAYYSPYSVYNDGYYYFSKELMCYDPVVSPSFICGFTTMGKTGENGCPAVIKNGYSWSKISSERYDNFYNQYGYMDGVKNSGYETEIRTNHNANTFANAPSTLFSATSNRMNGRITFTVKLNKNDVLQLFAVQREYHDENAQSVTYTTSAHTDLTIEAVSPKSLEQLLEKGYNYNSPTDFDVDLRLSNFLNKEKKMSDWVQNVIDAFNLEFIQDGKRVFFNKKKKIATNYINFAVDIDDRCNSADAEAEMIEYPKSMSVRYKIDTDEWGFEKSVYPQSKLNDADWKDYGDSGFTTIQLNDDSYVTSTSDKNLQFSYTWYDNFTWIPINSDHEDTGDIGDPITLRLPVISKYSYMIDGYSYEESMKHDGYGLPQRFWFKPEETDAYVWTMTYPAERINVYVPQNIDNGLNLSYKNTENSLLNNYFNITPYLASNYVKVEVYLTPDEYKSIKNGSMVRFDSNLYYPVEIEGYDCTGKNPTTIKMMTKI